jgi:hypothetical protein
MPQAIAVGVDLALIVAGLFVEFIVHWFVWLIDDDRKRKRERK